MKYPELGAVVVVFVACVMVSVASFLMVQHEEKSARLTDRASRVLEEDGAAGVAVPKDVCLEMLIDARTAKQEAIQAYKSGYR